MTSAYTRTYKISKNIYFIHIGSVIDFFFVVFNVA
jgi:hypothetical protein